MDPIGKTLQLALSSFGASLDIDEGPPREIVGVVRGVKYWGPWNNPPHVIYGSYRQHPWEYPRGSNYIHLMTEMATKRIKLAPVHPGEILREDFLTPLGLSINALARRLHVPTNHVSGIVNEERGISGMMSPRLARYFGTPPELWLGLQPDYELDLARDRAASRIETEVLPRAS